MHAFTFIYAEFPVISSPLLITCPSIFAPSQDYGYGRLCLREEHLQILPANILLFHQNGTEDIIALMYKTMVHPHSNAHSSPGLLCPTPSVRKDHTGMPMYARVCQLKKAVTE